tara:strand:+ start:14498 stop:15565 length:1068 start_codon:yes stop_codon:yes gene_type:complete
LDKQFKDKRFNKVDNQLILLNAKKKEILKDLYNSYEAYLTSIRSELLNSIRKGILSLAALNNINREKYEQNINFLINNEIKLLVNQILPFLTIEQLSLTDEINNENNKKRRSIDLNNNKFNYDKDLNKGHYFQYDYYDYYGNNIRDNFQSSIDLDNNYFENKEIKVDTVQRNINEDKKLFVSDRDSYKNKINSQEKLKSFCILNIFEENELSTILQWSDSIDNGLNKQLKKISMQVNKKIFSKNFSNEIIPENFLSYLFENNFLTTNPKPFVILFDLLSNEFIYNEEFFKNINFSKIYLFCVNPIELEFNNINLNIQRNKILMLRNLLKILIKKEQYWCNKKIVSNYDLANNGKN